MKPKKVICPICGEKMFPRNWGIERQMYRGFGDDVICMGESVNFVNYECSCGCQINYKGSRSPWEKCECKSCTRTEFQSEFDNDDND